MLNLLSDLLGEGTLEMLSTFVAEHGEAALRKALRSGHLFGSKMRTGSALALQHSAEYVEAGVPCAMVYVFHPRAKKAGERVDIRLLTGASKQITIELPAEDIPRQDTVVPRQDPGQ